MRFVSFALRFQDFTAGLLNLPKFPYPARYPRAFARDVDQRESGCVEERERCLAVAIVCSVFFLQYGQYRRVSLGNFIVNSRTNSKF